MAKSAWNSRTIWRYAAGDPSSWALLRIIPMHTTIVFGMFILFFVRGRTGEIVVLVLFLALKAWADLLMHVADRTGGLDLLLPEKMRRNTAG